MPALVSASRKAASLCAKTGFQSAVSGARPASRHSALNYLRAKLGVGERALHAARAGRKAIVACPEPTGGAERRKRLWRMHGVERRDLRATDMLGRAGSENRFSRR